MRKSTAYLLVLALILGAIVAYLAIQMNDVYNENDFTRRTLAEQRIANREVYDLDAKKKKLEDLNSKTLSENKRLADENDSLKRACEEKDKNIQKMELFSDNAKKNSDKLAAEKEALIAQINELDKKLELERRRADGFSEELAEIRNDADFKNLKKEVLTQKKRVAELENLLRDNEVEIAKLNDEIVSRERSIEAAKNDPRIQQMKEDLAAAEEEIKNLRQTNVNLRRRLARE